MPERDLDIDVDNLPQMPVEAREDGLFADNDGEQSEAEQDKTVEYAIPTESQSSQSSALTKLFMFIAFMAVIGVLLLGFLVFQQNQQLESAVLRVTELENRLSSTDESVSKSSVEIQINLKELKDRTDELWAQMDKLWASAWRRNQTDISDHKNQLDTHSKKMGTLLASSDAMQVSIKETQQDITVLRAQIDELFELSSRLDAEEKQSAKLQKRFTALNVSIERLQSSVKDQGEWLDSNNAFRQQTNKALSNIERQINQLQMVPEGFPD